MIELKGEAGGGLRDIGLCDVGGPSSYSTVHVPMKVITLPRTCHAHAGNPPPAADEEGGGDD